jgi:hypothetical protein
MAAFRAGLFVAGIQKAGTTTLFRLLAQHPRLLAPTRKETHVFDDETLDWTAPDPAGFHAMFPGATPDRIGFDCTPIYVFWPPSLPRILRYNPDARIVIIFRDPIDRAWSHWRMERRRGAEPLSFSAAIREGRARLPAGDPLDPAWRVHSYVERGCYATQIRRVLDIVPRGNLLFLDLGDLAADHRGVLDRIAGFLGIEPFPDLAARHDHASRADGQVMDAADAAYLRRVFLPEVEPLPGLTGLRVDRWRTMRAG